MSYSNSVIGLFQLGFKKNSVCFKGSVPQDFRPPVFSWFGLIWATEKQAEVFSNSPRFSITKLSPRCAAHRGDEKFFLFWRLKSFTFMIDLFTPKRISPDCLFKSNHRQVKISILTPCCTVCLRCDVYRGDHLHGMMHTTEIVSAVGCPPQRFVGVTKNHKISFLHFSFKNWLLKKEKNCFLCF